MVPMQIKRFRLNRASLSDARWLQGALNENSRDFGTRFEMTADGRLVLSLP